MPYLLFQRPPGRSAEEIQSEATGLSKNRLKQPDSVVTEADVESAPEEKREALRSKLGHPVCSGQPPHCLRLAREWSCRAVCGGGGWRPSASPANGPARRFRAVLV